MYYISINLTICHIPLTTPVDKGLDALVDSCARIIHLQLPTNIRQKICNRLTLLQWNRVELSRTTPQLAIRKTFGNIAVTPARYLTQFTKIFGSCIDVMMPIDLGAGIAL